MDAIALGRSWLYQCVHGHADCRQSTDPYLPTRVLRIEGTRRVKLYSPTDEMAAYACLGYCWGSQPFIQTTTSTFEEHLAGIAWEKLPQTIQDAVDFTHGLGLKYLWFVSLCMEPLL